MGFRNKLCERIIINSRLLDYIQIWNLALELVLLGKTLVLNSVRYYGGQRAMAKC